MKEGAINPLLEKAQDERAFENFAKSLEGKSLAELQQMKERHLQSLETAADADKENVRRLLSIIENAITSSEN